jgi:hypothetical protein
LALDDVDHVLRLAHAHWPDGVIDFGDGRGAHRLDDALKRRWPPPSDFSLHEAIETYESWVAHGPTEASDDSKMMLVVAEGDGVCFVTCHRDGEPRGLAEDMIAALAALRQNRWLANEERWFMNAPEEAA